MWTEASDGYKKLIGSADWDSRYLRERGLIPIVIDLIGDCREKIVLDAGAGTGWLFEHIQPKEAHACDLVRPETLPEYVTFNQDDVHRLSYTNYRFDLIVASLLLLYCRDLRTVLREFHRVSRKGAWLVLSLMHPYFYRTGEAHFDGSFSITEDLSHERQFDFRIAESVGPFVYYYRPLPVYINSLIETGWRIEQVKDWFINTEDYARFRQGGAKSNIQRTGRVPLYSFIKAIND